MDRMEIPVGCAGLFRLPIDFPMEANMQANFLGSGLSTASYYRNKGVAVTAVDIGRLCQDFLLRSHDLIPTWTLSYRLLVDTPIPPISPIHPIPPILD
ncbi:hypothetical protein FCV25MIE_18376 [Fagus crenata]